MFSSNRITFAIKLIVFLILLVPVLEISVRIFAPQQLVVLRGDIYEPDDGLGFKLRANVDTIVNTGEGPVHLVTDDRGFRIDPAKKNATDTPDFQILAVGGSFLASLQVEYNVTMIARIENTLSAALGMDVGITNTGVGGWRPNHELEQLRRELPNEDYDMILVFMYPSRDIQVSFPEHMPPDAPTKIKKLRIPKRLTKKAILNAVAYPLNDFFSARSQLFIYAREELDNFRAKIGLTVASVPLTLKKSEADSPAWSVTADLWEAMADEGARYDIPIVFVYLPVRYQIVDEDFEWYVEILNIDPAEIDVNQAYRNTARELNARSLTLLDTTPALRQAYESGATQLYGNVAGHFTPAAHKIVGDYISEWLLENTLAGLNAP